MHGYIKQFVNEFFGCLICFSYLFTQFVLCLHGGFQVMNRSKFSGWTLILIMGSTIVTCDISFE